MAEVNSRQAAAIAAGAKLLPSSHYGKVRVVEITTPATHSIALNDTLGSGVVLPVGTRFLALSVVSCAAMGASTTLSVGTRDPVTKAAISSGGIASGIAISTAGNIAAANGALIAAGVESTTTVPTELYLTFTGATPTANAQLRAEVYVVTND